MQQDKPILPGQVLPMIEGEFLTGRKASLPRDASGKIAFLALGFTYQSRFPVEAWSQRFQAEFKGNPKVAFFEIPMISGVAMLAKWFIDSGMRRGTPRNLHENVITVYGGSVARWKKFASYCDPMDAYLILINPEGKVCWRYSGKFNQEHFNGLCAAAIELLK